MIAILFGLFPAYLDTLTSDSSVIEMIILTKIPVSAAIVFGRSTLVSGSVIAVNVIMIVEVPAMFFFVYKTDARVKGIFIAVLVAYIVHLPWSEKVCRIAELNKNRYRSLPVRTK